MRNIFKNKKCKQFGVACSLMIGIGAFAMGTPVHAEETEPISELSQETSELMNTMFGIQSYTFNKTQDTQWIVDSLIKRLPLIEVGRLRNVDCRCTTFGAGGGQLSASRPPEERCTRSRSSHTPPIEAGDISCNVKSTAKEGIQQNKPSTQQVRSIEAQEDEFVFIETREVIDSYNNKNQVDAYLYGDYLVSIQNFNPSFVGQQKVDIEIHLLSMIDKQIVQNLKSTEYIQEAKPVYKQSVLLNVVDVTAPKIIMEKTEDTIGLNDSFDIHSYISSITDDVDTDIELNIEGNVDVTQEGDYTLKISAQDKSGNLSTEHFTAHVQESTGSKVAKKALSYRGTAYVWGGTTPYGFDCSGLVQYVYRQFGVSLPRVAQAQMHCGVGVSANQMKPGNLVIYGGGAHVAIYIGNGQVVHALNPEVGVTVGPWNTAYNGGVTAIRHIA